MDKYGQVWTGVRCRQLWTGMDSCGQVRTFVYRCGQLWTGVDSYGQVQTGVDSFEQVQTAADRYGQMWTGMDSTRVIQDINQWLRALVKTLMNLQLS